MVRVASGFQAGVLVACHEILCNRREWLRLIRHGAFYIKFICISLMVNTCRNSTTNANIYRLVSGDKALLQVCQYL
jgi:hypothetical protein